MCQLEHRADIHSEVCTYGELPSCGLFPSHGDLTRNDKDSRC
jgi:hypothetical protein